MTSEIEKHKKEIQDRYRNVVKGMYATPFRNKYTVETCGFISPMMERYYEKKIIIKEKSLAKGYPSVFLGEYWWDLRDVEVKSEENEYSKRIKREQKAKFQFDVTELIT